MSWILLLLKNLPALMAMIQTLIGIFSARAAMANHAAHQASVAAGQLMTATDATNWNWYVLGQGGGAAALGVSAAAFAFLQPLANRVHAAFAREQASERSALSQILASRDQAASAYLLLAQTEALSPKYQAIVKGN